MKFAIISPINGLRQFSARSTIHMALAPLLHNKEYLEFYKEMLARGDEVILDNGAYEGIRLADPVYFEAIEELHPTVAVLPDFPLSPYKATLSASLRFLDQYAGLTDVQWMYVPQALDMNDIGSWHTSLNTILQDTRVGDRISWVGLSRIFFGKCPVGWRPMLAAAMKRDIPQVKVHALGMLAGDIIEYAQLDQVGVYSCDSSAPVWRGWNEFYLNGESTLPTTDSWAEVGTEVDFYAAPPTEHAVTTIEENLRRLGYGKTDASGREMPS